MTIRQAAGLEPMGPMPPRLGGKRDATPPPAPQTFPVKQTQRGMFFLSHHTLSSFDHTAAILKDVVVMQTGDDILRDGRRYYAYHASFRELGPLEIAPEYMPVVSSDKSVRWIEIKDR